MRLRILSLRYVGMANSFWACQLRSIHHIALTTYCISHSNMDILPLAERSIVGWNYIFHIWSPKSGWAPCKFRTCHRIVLIIVVKRSRSTDVSEISDVRCWSWGGQKVWQIYHRAVEYLFYWFLPHSKYFPEIESTGWRFSLYQTQNTTLTELTCTNDCPEQLLYSDLFRCRNAGRHSRNLALLYGDVWLLSANLREYKESKKGWYVFRDSGNCAKKEETEWAHKQFTLIVFKTDS